MAEQMRTLLVEDDAEIAAAIVALLTREGIAVEVAADGATGIARAGDPAIDVVILDRMLPALSGTEVIARLRRAGVEKPVLMLSALGRAEHRIEGLDAGVDDYLAKPFEPAELIARLRALYRRTTVHARQPILICGDVEVHVLARTAHRAGRHLGLSPKEFDILKYLMENAGEIVTRDMLLRHVWKLDFDPQTNVVDVNLVRLRRKLEDGFDGVRLETGARARLPPCGAGGRAVRLTMRSIAVRQALWSTLVALLAMIGVGAAIITAVDARLRTDLQRTIDTDLAGLADIMATGGAGELARRIGDRTDFAAATPAFYRLETAGGSRLAGNLGPVALNAARSAARAVTVDGAPVLVRATRLRGDLRLTVGRSLAPVTALTSRLWRILAVAAVVTLALSLAIGLAIAAQLARRIGAINAVFDRFAGGDMRARAESGGDDEVARLTAHVDVHLDRIETLFDAQREVSDNIAHELRTPMVHLDSRLLRALETDLDPRVAEQLVAARGDIRSVVALLDTLLDIALAESAAGRAALPAIDLSALATDVADLYAASAEEAGIAFSTRIASDVSMRGEAMQMTRLIANLLDNALKYVPAGGHVRLSLATGPRLVVEDDGPGIPAADRERVFQRFHRVAATGPGHGLGLALVRVIAARHGLVARVEDAGPGARFVVEPASAG